MDYSIGRNREILEGQIAMGAGYESDDNCNYVGGVLSGGIRRRASSKKRVGGSKTSKHRSSSKKRVGGSKKRISGSKKKVGGSKRRVVRRVGGSKRRIVKRVVRRVGGSKVAKKKATRKPSAYNKFVKEYAANLKKKGIHLVGPSLISAAAARWSGHSQSPAQWNKRHYVNHLTKQPVTLRKRLGVPRPIFDKKLGFGYMY